MNAEQLIQNFDRIAESPGSIAHLRRFILDLAVRGKLVEQDPNDEPVSKLFNHLNQVTTFDINPGWLLGKFGDLLNMQYGKGLPTKDRKQEGKVPIFGSNGIVGFTDDELTTEPAIIIGRKGSAGALNLCNGASWTTDVAYFLIPPNFFNIRFLLFTLETLNLKSLGKGVKPGLSRTEAYQLPVTIPPLAEQHRIVAKVDELMGLCDRLETELNIIQINKRLLLESLLHEALSSAT